MNAKRWAVFFVFLFSSDYVLMATASLVRHKRQSGCQPKPKMEELFDKCFEDAKADMPDEFNLGNMATGNLQLLGGTAQGLTNFRRTAPMQCMCMKDFVRVFVQVSFIDITVTFLVTLLDGLLGGLLGNLGTALTRLLGQVVDLVVKLVALEINVVIAVDQKLGDGSSCRVVSYRVTRVSGIKILNIDLTNLVVGLLGEVLTPVIETLLKNLLDRQVRAIITRQIQKLTITPDMFSC